MGGFFLDSIIRSIAKSARREARTASTEEWLLVDARISSLKVGDGSRFRPAFVYTYQVDEEIHYGSANGFDIEGSKADVIRAAMDAIPMLRVRYDPNDPMSSRLLNRDNPALPFEIDHDPF